MSKAKEPEALPDWIVECLSRLFSSISDPTRIRIVHVLTEHERLNVSQLAATSSVCSATARCCSPSGRAGRSTTASRTST